MEQCSMMYHSAVHFSVTKYRTIQDETVQAQYMENMHDAVQWNLMQDQKSLQK